MAWPKNEPKTKKRECLQTLPTVSWGTKPLPAEKYLLRLLKGYLSVPQIAEFLACKASFGRPRHTLGVLDITQNTKQCNTKLHRLIRNPTLGLPWWLSGKQPACQCRRPGFDPWSGKIPHAAGQLSLCITTTEPVFWSHTTEA